MAEPPLPNAPLNYCFRWRKYPELYEYDIHLAKLAKHIVWRTLGSLRYDYKSLEICFYQPVDIKEIKFRNNFASNVRLLLKRLPTRRKVDDCDRLPWKIAVKNLVMMKDPRGLEGGYELYFITPEQSLVPFTRVLRICFSVKRPATVLRIFDIRGVTVIGKPTFPKEGVIYTESPATLRRTVDEYKREMARNFCPQLMPVFPQYEDCDEAASIFGSSDIGYIGSSVAGHFLILFLIDKGIMVNTYDTVIKGIIEVIKEQTPYMHHGPVYERKHIARLKRHTIVVHSVEEVASNLKYPRIVVLSIEDEDEFDAAMKRIMPLIHPDGVIIDAAETKYTITNRRCKLFKEQDLLFVGCGIKIERRYAETPVSLMLGGAQKKAWPRIKDLLRSISIKVNDQSCCDWIGEGASGQFVKILHDGIEQAEIQLMYEVYLLLKEGLGLDHDTMADIFTDWDQGIQASYLMRITSNIFRCKYNLSKAERDEIDKTGFEKFWYRYPLLNMIYLPKKYKLRQIENIFPSAVAALELNAPITLIIAAISARYVSPWRRARLYANALLKGPSGTTYKGDKNEFIKHIQKAYYASRIMCYTQAFMMIREAAKAFNWKLNYSTIIQTWKGYDNTKSTLLDTLKATFEEEPDLQHLFKVEFFENEINRNQESWRYVIATAVMLGIPTPGMNAGLSFFDGWRTEVLPANLIEAMRNYLGYDMFELFKWEDKRFSVDWSGKFVPKWLGP